MLLFSQDSLEEFDFLEDGSSSLFGSQSLYNNDFISSFLVDFDAGLTFSSFSDSSDDHDDDHGKEPLDHAHILPISAFGLATGAGGDDGQGFLNEEDRGAGIVEGKPSFGTDLAALQLIRSGTTWGGEGVNVSYAFRSTAPSSFPSDTSDFTRFNATQIAQTEAALESWADVANINFIRVGSGSFGNAAYSNNATLLFSNYGSGREGAAAFAFFPGSASTFSVSGDSWYNSTLSYNVNPSINNYGRLVLVHEIGHAIGISHPGTYNAGDGVSITYNNDAEYYEDSLQYTTLSYFSPGHTGGATNGRFPAAPLLDDITAAQVLYGVNTTTRTDDTIYGFNSNTDRDFFTINSAFETRVFAVWDAGGTDTFDFSGYNQNQFIDLTEGHFSNVGGLIGNVSIAQGVVIERAIGGTGNDTIVAGDAVISDLFSDAYEGIGTEQLILTKGSGTFNNTPGTAISLDEFFTLAPNNNIEDATITPHATVNGAGSGALEYYSFTVSEAGTIGTFDVDNTPSLDAYLYLFNANNELIAFNDDSHLDAGSTDRLDSTIIYEFHQTGTYYILIDEFSNDGPGPGVPVNASYQLNVSLKRPDDVVVRDYIGYELLGGAGNDTLVSGFGDDVLTGGAGIDIFQISNLTGIDTITDFSAGTDKIDLSGMDDQVILTGGRSGVQADFDSSVHFFQDGAHTYVALLKAVKNPTYTPEDAFLILENTNASDLSLEDDFIL